VKQEVAVAYRSPQLSAKSNTTARPNPRPWAARMAAATALCMLSCAAVAQSTQPANTANHSAAAKPASADAAQNSKFDPRDLSGVWNPAPYMQPKGEVNPLDLGGNPKPLPPFTPTGRAAYEAK
jgi:hypothetical protein